MLRHDAPRIYDAVMDVVFQMFGERLVNDAERLAFVVPGEMLHVFQNEGEHTRLACCVCRPRRTLSQMHDARARRAAPEGGCAPRVSCRG